jgi:hypothetical protein
MLTNGRARGVLPALLLVSGISMWSALVPAYAVAAPTPAPASQPGKVSSPGTTIRRPSPVVGHAATKKPQAKPANPLAKTQVKQPATPPAKPVVPPTTPIPAWLVYLLVAAGGALLAVLAAFAVNRRPKADPGKDNGPALLATLPVLAALGFGLIPFAPNLGDGRWIPVDIVGLALFIGGALLGFLYGLPVVDPDALKAVGTSAGTFVRPGSKLDKVIDSIMPALTGGVLTYALTQGGHFNAWFIRYAHLPTGSPSELLGLGILVFFTPIGFMLAYTLTSTVGALAFKQAEEVLVQESAIVKAFPAFPDLPDDPKPEQIIAATAIASLPYGSLRTASEKAAWARAQTLLGNYADALPTYQDAIVLDPRNPSLLLDYATCVYNDPAVDDVQLVLDLVARAEQIAGPQAAPDLRKRILAIRAAATLYVTGGYEAVIALVNGWIASPVPTTPFARFYRACAFGQLYEACATVPTPAAPPYAGLNAADATALRDLVHEDVAITIVVAQEKGRDNLRMVIDPNSPLRSRPDDDDLQTLAADDPVLCAQVGVNPAPPPAGAPRPPAPTTIPNPITAPGTLAPWIAANCPP